MPVPFHEGLIEDGLRIGVLRILPSGNAGTFAGGLLLARDNGEPVEFAYNHLDVPVTSLCTPDRLPAVAAVLLARSLFGGLQGTPAWILVLGGETSSELFDVRLRVQVPVLALHLGQGGLPDQLRWLGNTPPSDEIGAAANSVFTSGLGADLLARAEAALHELRDRQDTHEPLVGRSARA